MKEVQDGELSALLDGELDSQRAEVVRAAINADPALREEFDALARLDARLRSAAEEAAFMPDVSFPAAAARQASAWHWPAGVALVLALIAIRFLPKLAELPLFGISLQVAACAAVSFIVVRMVRETEPLADLAFGKGIQA
jgi:anti-sigma factor RsiW